MLNREEKIEKIKHMKNYFFISFLVSYFFLLLSSLICIAYFDSYSLIAEKLFKLKAEEYSYILVFLLGFWKILIVQFTLIPAIALFIIEKFHKSCK